MSAARQICHSGFDASFFQLPPKIQSRIEAKIDDLGLRLKTSPHHRLKGHNRFRLRAGDYRIIYTFDAARSVHAASPRGSKPAHDSSNASQPRTSKRNEFRAPTSRHQSHLPGREQPGQRGATVVAQRFHLQFTQPAFFEINRDLRVAAGQR